MLQSWQLCAHNGLVVGCSEWDCQRFTLFPYSLRNRKEKDRLCGSLILSIQESFLIPFGMKTPATYSKVHGHRLRGVPSQLAVWTFLTFPGLRQEKRKDPLYQRVLRSIPRADKGGKCEGRRAKDEEISPETKPSPGYRSWEAENSYA